MRVLFPATLLAIVLGMAAAAKPVLPRTLWERKVRTDKRRAQTGIPSSSTDELRDMLKINEGTLASFDKITNQLVKYVRRSLFSSPSPPAPTPTHPVSTHTHSKVDFGGIDMAGEEFTKMFSTFKILKQSPAYTEAMAKGLDTLTLVRLLRDPFLPPPAFSAFSLPPPPFPQYIRGHLQQEKGTVLADAVKQLANLAVNLQGGMSAASKEEGGINNKVLEFLKKGDANTLALAEKVSQGDASAIFDLQQNFMDEQFPGLTIKSIPDDEFVMAARSFLENDEGLKNLIGEENTLSVLFDNELLFKNNPTLEL